MSTYIILHLYVYACNIDKFRHAPPLQIHVGEEGEYTAATLWKGLVRACLLTTTLLGI